MESIIKELVKKEVSAALKQNDPEASKAEKTIGVTTTLPAVLPTYQQSLSTYQPSLSQHIKYLV